MTMREIERISCKAKMNSGVYETTYGNACEYFQGDNIAYDLDIGEAIPLEAVNFEKFIRELE